MSEPLADLAGQGTSAVIKCLPRLERAEGSGLPAAGSVKVLAVSILVGIAVLVCVVALWIRKLVIAANRKALERP